MTGGGGRSIGPRLWWVLVAIMATWGGGSVRAILFQSTGDPAYNTGPPTGSLAGSGWQWQGQWGRFLGTPIHRKYFLTAAHVGGQVGQVLLLNGQAYTTTFSTNVPGSDLRLWRICGEFEDYAPVHASPSNLVGRNLIWFGRGTQRGAAVISTNDTTTELRGWEWGPRDDVVRWGTNRVEEVYEGDEGIGPLLRAAFDLDGGADECHLSSGDSGGAAFVQAGDHWELVGIHYAVDGPYRRTVEGTTFNAALFDQRGFFAWDGADWLEMTEEDPVAGSLYTTDVTAHADWIVEFVSRPVPADDTPVLQSAGVVQGPFADVPDAVVETESRTIRLSVPAAGGYFRLRSCSPSRITDVVREGDSLVLRYE